MKFLLSFAILTMSVILLAPAFINGAPTTPSQDSSSPQTPEQVNKTIKEGLKVMLAVMRSFSSTRPRVRRSIVENGVCRVVDYISQVMSNDQRSANSSSEGAAQNETTTFFSRNSSLVEAERIQNDTCNWVNAIKKNTIPTCSIEALELLCLHIRIFEVTVRASVATATVVDGIDEGQWINTHFPEDSPVREQLCSLFQCPTN